MQGHNSTNARGIDCSDANGYINWQDVKRTGVAFAICKATEGATYHDPTFGTNYAGAKSVGLIRGAYCFARPRTSTALDEANSFVTVVNAQGGFDELPPILDMEDNGGLSPAELTSWIMTWMNQVKKLTGRQPILYTYELFAKTNLLPSLSSIPLWIATYQNSAPSDVNGWTKWLMWQYIDKDVIDSKNFDESEFAGTVQDLINYCKGGNIVTTLQVGSSGTDVKTLQEKLQFVLGLDPKKFVADGSFGAQTQAAVKSFQTQYHVSPVDGVVGSITETALDKAVESKKAKLSTPAPAPKPVTQASTAPVAQPAPVSPAPTQTDAVAQAEAQLKQAIADEIAKANEAQAKANEALAQVAQAQAQLVAMQKKMADAQTLMQNALDALK